MKKRFAKKLVSYLLVGALIMQDGIPAAAADGITGSAEAVAASELDAQEISSDEETRQEAFGGDKALESGNASQETQSKEEMTETENGQTEEKQTESEQTEEKQTQEQQTENEQTEEKTSESRTSEDSSSETEQETESTMQTEIGTETETETETEAEMETETSEDDQATGTEESTEEETEVKASEEMKELAEDEDGLYPGDKVEYGENMLPEDVFKEGENGFEYWNTTDFRMNITSTESLSEGKGITIQFGDQTLGGDYLSSIYLTKSDFKLENGHAYQISYKITSTKDRAIQSGFDGTGDRDAHRYELKADTETTISYNITTNGEWNKLMFFMGQVGDMSANIGEHTITISDLSIQEKKITLADGEAVEENPDNLLTNGTFKDGNADGWTVNDTNATVKYAKYKVAFDITGNPADYQIWLRQDGITLDSSKKYEISFQATSTVDRYILVGSDGAWWLKHAKLEANKPTTVEYKVTGVGGGNNFVIALGANPRGTSAYQDWDGNEIAAEPAKDQTLPNHRVTISNVCITELQAEIPDTPNDTPYNKITDLSQHDGYKPSDLVPLKDGRFIQRVPVKSFGASDVETNWLLAHESWMTEWNEEAITCTPVENGVAVYIENTGGGEGNHPWDVQLKQTISLSKDTEYVLSFKVKSEQRRSINISIGDIGENGQAWVKSIAIQKGETREVILNLPKLTQDAMDKTFQIEMGNVSGGVEKNTLTFTDMKLEVNGYSELAERISDGSFDGGNQGQFTVTDGGKASVSFDDSYIKAEVTSDCNENDVVVSSGTFDLLGESAQRLYEYEASFVAGAADNRTIKAVLADVSGAILTEQSFDLTIDAQKYSFTYKPDAPKKNVCLKLLLGGSAETICVDTIRCDLKGYPEAAGLDTEAHDITLLEKKAAPVISEMPADRALKGQDIILSFDKEGNEAYKDAIQSVSVDGKEVDKTQYQIGERTNEGGNEEYTITLDSALFQAAGDRQTFTIEVKASGDQTWYQKNRIRQTVYTDSIWRRTWLEEFDGTALDMDKWSYQTGTGDNNDGWGNNEQQCYTDKPDNLQVGNGELTITARKQKNDSGRPYTSARIWTMNEDGKTAKFAQTYGRMEAKIKMAGGEGLEGVWPAFWMLPADLHYGTWPLSGEIDILEARGREPHLADGTVHYGKPWPNNESQGGVFDYSQSQYNQDSDINDYHIYAVEWEPGEIRWYVDDELYFTYSNWYSQSSNNPAKFRYPAPFDQDFYIILNLAIGGTFDNNLMPDDSKMPVDMKVDYVRVYEAVNGYQDVTAEPPVIKDEDTDINQVKSELKDTDFAEINIIKTDDGSLKRDAWNLVTLPSFGGSADFAAITEDDTVYGKITPTKIGGQAHGIQLIQHLDLVKGYSYRISFDAWTEGSRKINMKIGQDGSEGWNTYQTFETSLTDTKQHYKYEFQSGVTDLHSRLEFNLATSLQPVYIGNIKYEVIEGIVIDPDAEKTPFEDGNCVYNGSFDIGQIDGLSYWHLADSDGKTVRDGRGYAFSASKGDLYQYGIQLLQSDSYELTFKGEAAGTRQIEITLSDRGGTEIYHQETVTVSTSRETKTVKFTMPKGVTDTNATLRFGFGGAGAPVTITKIWLKRTTYENIEWDEVNAHPLLNGDFEMGDRYWSTYNTALAIQVENDGSHYAQIDGKKGGDKWDAVTSQSGLEITGKTDYELSFDIWASKDDEAIRVTLEEPAPSYYAHFEQKELPVGTQKQHYVYDLRFPDTLKDMSLSFQTGGGSEEYKLYLDNIVLRAKGAPKAPGVLIADQYNRLGTDITLAYQGEADWAKNAEVYINNVRIDKEKAVFDNGRLRLDQSVFTASDTYSLVVRSEGYTQTKAVELRIYPENGNRIMNDGFAQGDDGMKYWGQYILKPDQDTVAVENGMAKIHYGGPVYNYAEIVPWAIMLNQPDIPVEAGKKYQLSFFAHASMSRRIQVTRKYGQGNELSDIVSITKVPKLYKIEFDAASDNLELIFMLSTIAKKDGEAVTEDDILPAHDIFIDNVTLMEMNYGDVEIDKTALKALLDECSAILENDQDKYTPESYDALAAAVASAKRVWEDEGAEAAEVSQAEDILRTAKSKLEARVDRTSLQALIEECGTLRQEDYTQESWEPFAEALAAAGDILQDESAQQEDIDQAQKALEEARGALVFVTEPDRTALESLIDACGELEEEAYTKESWKAFAEALEAARKVLADAKAGQAVIDQTEQTLSEAKEALIPVNVTRNDLRNLIETCEELDPEKYTAESWKAFASVLDKAKEMVDGASQEEVEAVYVELILVRKALEPIPNKTQLNDLVNACEALRQNDYTQESWSPFAKALEEAKAALADTAATQDSIQKAAEALEQAKSNLKKRDDLVDMDQLRKLIRKCEQLNQNDYKQSGWEVFAKALADAKAVAEDDAAVQESIEDAVRRLSEALEQLREKEGLWAIDIEDITYTGKAVQPAVTVYDGSMLLIQGRDYTISYTNNKAVTDNAQAVIKGKGNYSGTITKVFRILPKDIRDDDILISDLYEKAPKAGKSIIPMPTVTRDGRKLSKKEYVVSAVKDSSGHAVQQVTASGEYTVEVSGVKTNGYTGTRVIRLTVLSKDQIPMSAVKVTGIKNKLYTGQKVIPEFTVKYKKDTLVLNQDYVVSCDSSASGAATAVIKGTGRKYVGERTITFKIIGKTLKAKDVTVDTANAVYTGKSVEPVVAVAGAECNRDYIVSYANNTKAGTAVVTVQGIGQYTGTVQKRFKITAFDMKENLGGRLEYNMTGLTAPYAKGGSKLDPQDLNITFDGVLLTEGVDYTLVYKSNKKAGAAASVRIKGKGCFKGTTDPISFTVTKQNLENLTNIYAVDVTAKKAGSYKRVIPVLKDLDGKALKNGKDFRITGYTKPDGTAFEGKPHAGDTIRVTVAGINSYRGQTSADFRMIENNRDISKAKVKVEPQSYTGKEIQLSERKPGTGRQQIVVTMQAGGVQRTLKEGRDYEIIETAYSKNVKRGTAKMTIRGINEYGGVKTVPFKITARTFEDVKWYDDLYSKTLSWFDTGLDK